MSSDQSFKINKVYVHGRQWFESEGIYPTVYDDASNYTSVSNCAARCLAIGCNSFDVTLNYLSACYLNTHYEKFHEVI